MESPLYIFTASNLNAVIDKLLASSWNKAMDEFMLKYEYEIQSQWELEDVINACTENGWTDHPFYYMMILRMWQVKGKLLTNES